MFGFNITRLLRKPIHVYVYLLHFKKRLLAIMFSTISSCIYTSAQRLCVGILVSLRPSVRPFRIPCPFCGSCVCHKYNIWGDCDVYNFPVNTSKPRSHESFECLRSGWGYSNKSPILNKIHQPSYLSVGPDLCLAVWFSCLRELIWCVFVAR